MLLDLPLLIVISLPFMLCCKCTIAFKVPRSRHAVLPPQRATPLVPHRSDTIPPPSASRAQRLQRLGRSRPARVTPHRAWPRTQIISYMSGVTRQVVRVDVDTAMHV